MTFQQVAFSMFEVLNYRPFSCGKLLQLLIMEACNYI